MNKILYMIYRSFAPKFQEFLVDDYVSGLPREVVEEAFSVASDNKKKLKRLTNYLAYNLHKKMGSDPTNSLVYKGMFIQLKMMDAMIIGRPDTEKPPTNTQPTEKQNKFKEHFEAATNFAANVINGKEE